MERTPQRGRPLTSGGHVDRVAEGLIDVRGHLVVILGGLTDTVQTLNQLAPHLTALRDVVDGRAAA